MMTDNAAHHPVVQLNTTSPQSINNIRQPNQHDESKLTVEPEQFLTIRLLMQGKVSHVFLFWIKMHYFHKR